MSLKDLLMKNKEEAKKNPPISEEMLRDEYINYKVDNYMKIKRLNELLLSYHRDHNFVRSEQWKEYEALQKSLTRLPEIEEKLAIFFGPQGASEFKRIADIEVIKQAYKRNKLDKEYVFNSLQTMLSNKDGKEDEDTKNIQARFNESLGKNKILEEDLIESLGQEEAYKYFEEVERGIRSKTNSAEDKNKENSLNYTETNIDGSVADNIYNKNEY